MSGRRSLLTQFPDLAWRKWWDKKIVRFRRNGKRPNFLHEVTLLLTFRCSLRCRMCPEWGEEGLFLGREKELHREELPVERWVEIARELQPFKPALVVLGGGEPFLYKGWEEVAIALQKFTRVMVISNGLPLASHISSLLAYVDILHVSLDGDERAHDSIRGEGVYRKAICHLKDLIEERRRCGKKKPLVRISATLLPGVRSNLRRMVEEVFSFGVDGVIVQHLMYLGQREIDALSNCSLPFQKAFWQSYRLTLSQKEQFLEELHGFKRWLGRSPYRENVQFHPSLPESEWKAFYGEREYPPSSFQRGCMAPYLQVTVLPSGEVWLCPGLTIGNIKEHTLGAILDNEKARNLLRALSNEFPFPVCAGCCYLYGYSS